MNFRVWLCRGLLGSRERTQEDGLLAATTSVFARGVARGTGTRHFVCF